jgi:NitT/TauT family transport system substrate-binding protein
MEIRTLFTLVIVALGVFATGCGGGREEQAPTGGAEGTNVLRVGTQPGAELAYGSFFVARENGYFQEEGVRANVLSFQNGPLALTELASGNLDAAMAAWLPHVQAFAQGTPMQVVASLAKDNTTLVGGPGVDSIRDLEGANVGTPGIGTIHDAALDLLAEREGIEVKHVPAKITDLPIMLRRGEIKAFMGWETVASQAVLTIEGAKYLERKPVPGNENLEIAVHKDLIEERPEMVQALVNGIYRGAKYADACPEQYVKKIATLIRVPDAQKITKAASESVDNTKPRLHSETAKQWYQLAVKARKVDTDKWSSYAEFEDAIWNPTFLDKAEAKHGDWQPQC